VQVADPIQNAMFFKVSESIFYAFEQRTKPESFDLPQLKRAIRRYGGVVLESKTLVCDPLKIEGYEYTKGIAVFQEDSELIGVYELTLVHPGTTISGMAVNHGYQYRWNNVGLQRVPHKDDCPCGHEARHWRHLAALEALDSHLDKGSQTAPLTIEVFP